MPKAIAQVERRKWNANFGERKRNMTTRKLIILFTSLLLLLSAPVFADPIELVVAPSDTEIILGDTVSVDVNVSGLGDGEAPSLSSYDLILQFDSLILSFLSVDWGTELGLFSLQLEESVPGGHSFVEISFDFPDDLDLLQPPAFTLFTAHFSSIATGVSPLVLDTIALGDSLGNSLESNTTNSSVTVKNPSSVGVPEPGVLSLLTVSGIGLMMFSLYRRKLTQE